MGLIDADKWFQRADYLYEGLVKAQRRMLLKGQPRNIKIDLPAAEIMAYTRHEFHQWLSRVIGDRLIKCPYCGAPIDVFSMELDHKTPTRKGGDNSLSNLHCICARDNRVKGTFNHEQYLIMVAFFEGPAASFRAQLEGVLINGGVGSMMRLFPKKGAGKKPFAGRQDRMEFSESSPRATHTEEPF